MSSYAQREAALLVDAVNWKDRVIDDVRSAMLNRRVDFDCAEHGKRQQLCDDARCAEHQRGTESHEIASDVGMNRRCKARKPAVSTKPALRLSRSGRAFLGEGADIWLEHVFEFETKIIAIMAERA